MQARSPNRISAVVRFDAISELVRSPYLMGVAAWVGLLSYAATIIYFEQAHIVSEAVKTAGLQTRVFASIDLAVNLLTVTTQLLLTGRVLRRLGTGIAAAALPAVYIVGFAVLAVMPTLAVVITIQVLQRWMNFSIANPARQVFFTVVTRAEKYKAKNLIDVVVYRGSDALSGWIFDSLQGLGTQDRCNCALFPAGGGGVVRPFDRIGARARKTLCTTQRNEC